MTRILNSVPFLAPFLLLTAFSRSASADECFVWPLDTPSGSGSITIIGASPEGSYTFLTASHVISGIGKGDQLEIELKLNGDLTYVNAGIIKDFSSEGIDLSVGKFKLKRPSSEICARPIFALAPDNNRDDDNIYDDGNIYKEVPVHCDNKAMLYKYGYETCTRLYKSSLRKVNEYSLCDWHSLGRFWKDVPCDKPPKINVKVPVSFGTWNRRENGVDGIVEPYQIIGYSMATRAINARMLRVSTAHLEQKMNGNKDGYDYIYSLQSSVPGMSGGPLASYRYCPPYSGLYNSRRYQGIIGIHGRSEEYGGSGGRSGMGLSIPLTNKVIADYLKSNSDQLFIPEGEDYKKLILRICETDTIKYVL